MRVIDRKEVRVSGSNGIFSFLYSYVEQKREDVFEKAMERAGNNLSFNILEFERVKVSLDETKPSLESSDGDFYYLVTDTLVTEEDILKLFHK